MKNVCVDTFSAVYKWRIFTVFFLAQSAENVVYTDCISPQRVS